MTEPVAPGVDAHERDRLEREREFLLRSLDDLDREREAGAIDDESYTRLRDDYTARAAVIIRALGDGEGAQRSPAAAPVSRRRRVLTASAIAVFVIVVAVTLAAALSDRLPGQTSSGNAAADRSTTSTGGEGLSVAERRRRLEQVVADNPGDIASRLLLARYVEAGGDLAGALRQYDAVLALAPESAEAQAQAGRILYLTARAAVASNPESVDGLVLQAKARLDRAVEIDPTYPDARFFRAIVEANEFGDFAAAQNDLQRYLIAAPEGQFGTQARQLLAEVTAAIEGTPLPTTPSTSRPDR